MAYRGFLFKFGEYTFPDKFIKFDTFDVAPNQRQDIDSYTDANGVTHRNAISHTKTQIQFTVRSVKETVMESIMSGISGNYINANERDAYCTYYDPETITYKTGHFYLDPSLKFRLKGVQNEELLYGETQFLFIEY